MQRTNVYCCLSVRKCGSHNELSAMIHLSNKHPLSMILFITLMK